MFAVKPDRWNSVGLRAALMSAAVLQEFSIHFRADAVIRAIEALPDLLRRYRGASVAARRED